MNTKKTITRATRDSAFRAMAAHVAKMIEKGWKVDQEFGGDAGLVYKCTTYFYK